MTRLMNAGASWSGHERHCGFVNLSDGTFADISAVLGIDLLDDGRALAVTDWDADGNLDLWFKNRSGPQLRFMHNNGTPRRHFVAFKLQGKSCNRDAIGAVVELHTGGRRITRTVNAGDGYLSQSSKWLHFGLDSADRIDRLVVHWPGAEPQPIDPPPVDARYRLTQGDSPVRFDRPPPWPNGTPPQKPTDIPQPTGRARVVLRVPLPLPPTLIAALFPEPTEPTPSDTPRTRRAKLISLWAAWCTPCWTELSEFAAHYDQFRAARLDVCALNLDAPEDRNQALELFKQRIPPTPRPAPSTTTPPPAAPSTIPSSGVSLAVRAAVPAAAATAPMRGLIEAVLHHVLDKPGDIALPTHLLIDPDGALEIIYLGPVSIDQLRADAAAFCHRRAPAATRAPFPGRWYYRIRRNVRSLARDLLDRHLPDDARFYARLPK